MPRSQHQANAHAFIAAYRQTASISKAAAAAKVDRGMHYRWLKGMAGYKEAFARAQDDAAQILEDEAVRRATEGTLEPVFYQGIKCGAVRRFSDGLMQFLLRGFRPDKYAQRINADVNITGTLDLVQRLNAARKRASEHSDVGAPGKPGPG